MPLSPGLNVKPGRICLVHTDPSIQILFSKTMLNTFQHRVVAVPGISLWKYPCPPNLSDTKKKKKKKNNNKKKKKPEEKKDILLYKVVNDFLKKNLKPPTHPLKCWCWCYTYHKDNYKAGLCWSYLWVMKHLWE